MKMRLIASVQKMIFISVFLFSACGSEKKQANLPDPKDSTANANLAREISKEIENDPTNTEALYRRAQVYFNSKYLSRAEADLQAILAIDSSDAMVYFTLGRTQYAMNQTKAAANAYEKAIALNPNFTEAQIKLADLYFVVKEHQKSLDLLNVALKKEKGNAYIYHMLGMNYREMGDTARAIYHYQTAIETDPTDYNSNLYIANLYAAQKKEIALAYFKAAIKLRPTWAEPIFARAVFLQSVGSFKAAMLDYKKVVDLEPSNYLAYYNVGYINYEAGFLDQALNSWDLCLKINPQFANAWYMKGLIYEEKGDFNEAIKNHKMALDLMPENPLFREAQKRLQK
jgi:tetratricopeptide (TPR) repeat protein